jgi:hypothetical protein
VGAQQVLVVVAAVRGTVMMITPVLS